MKKNIWILNHYAGETFFDKGGRHFWFAKHLKKAGYYPVIFCCNTKHNPGTEEWMRFDGLWREQIEEELGVPYVFVKAKKYAGNGAKRMINMADFAVKLRKAANKYTRDHLKPDVIYASSIHPLTLVAGIRIARRFKVPCICEMRDLWPEELIDMGVISNNSILTKCLYSLEKYILRKADKIIFTFEGGKQYIKDKGLDKKGVDLNKVYYINNGYDKETYLRNIQQYDIEDEDLDNQQLFKVVYTGAIRKANGIDRIVEIAKEFRNRNIRFLIWGNGDYVEDLKRSVEEEALDNVVYKGFVEKKYVPRILSKGDLNILNYQNGALFKYGCSNNKLFEYIASGKPILSTVKMGYSIINKYHCGIEAETIEDSVAEINRILGMSESEKQEFQRNSCRAKKDFEFDVLTNKLIGVIDEA